MGTLSTTKFIKNNAGALTEEAALTTSAGAGDAQKLVALNAAGILDDTITNAKASSTGAGDAGKLAKLNVSGVLDPTLVNSTVASAGAGDAGKHPRLDGSGRLDSTVLPVGVGADTVSVPATENLAAGDLVNIWDDSGPGVRKADATTSGKEAHGFVLAAVSSGNPATVYFEGTNTQLTGLTPGVRYLSTTPGLTTGTPPSGSGNVVQRVGFAVSTSAMNFQSQPPIVLA